MSVAAPSPDALEPTVLNALRSPRSLRIEVFAGLAVALALIPEAISFSILAGVDPQVGLFASFTMAVTISIVGGRRAMISAATGAIALVVAPVAKDYGLDYLVATVILGGVLQVLFSVAGAAKLMRFVPRSVMVGFVNALAIVIFTAQLPELIDVPAIVYPLVAAGIAILVFLPRVSRVVPAPLVVIVLLTIVVVLFGVDIPDVGDQGDLPSSLPTWFIPNVPWTLETLQTIAPYAFAMAMVGLLESLMTAKLVDDITDSHSDKTREGWGQGVANIVTGFFGGMGGCAMIGQTMINVKESGARTRLSTFLSGVFLLILVVGLGDTVAKIPMAGLVAVMIMVSVGTMDWHSVNPKTLRQMPLSATTIMIATVLVTVTTHNLAYGVIVGVIVAMVFFARRVAHFTEVIDIAHPDDHTRVYAVR
jgi:SulP family sulfate permease